jgi:hypothetical protein
MSGTSPEQARSLNVVKRAPLLVEHNMNENEQMIREQAYELWDHAGRPDGRSDEFWFAARAEFERGEETGEGNLSAHVPPHVEAVSS